MWEFIKENFAWIMENHGDKVGLSGITLMILGGAVFLGATPRGMGMNAIGEGWMLALPMIAAGLILFGVNWLWNR